MDKKKENYGEKNMQEIENLEKQIEALAPKAARIAEQKEQILNAEAKSLTKLIEKVKPVLPSISYRIRTGYYHSGQQFHREKLQHAARPGIILVDRYTEVYTDRDTRGDYEGDRLVLFQDGRLCYMERAGEWSRWQGEGSEWNTMVEKDIEPMEAVRNFGFKAILEGLQEALAKAAKYLESTESGLDERKSRVESINALLA